MCREWRVRLLRHWYGLRERLGFPRKMSEDEFADAGATTLLAGSPWIWVVTPHATSNAGTTKFVVTNTTWTARKD